MRSKAHIIAVLKKQIKDSVRNPLILVIFFMFPILSFFFKGVVSDEEFEIILPSFITLNTVMLPIVFMSSIISEDKEKKSLQMLIMSNVKGWAYLLGIGISVFFQSLVSSMLFLFVFSIESFEQLLLYIFSSIVGICCSLLIGGILALVAKNQMSVGPLTAPVSMIIGLLPMFSAMNKELESISKLLYSYYIRKCFLSLSFDWELNSVMIIIINFIVLTLTFIVLYRIRGNKNE